MSNFRNIHQIADDIRKDWKSVNYAAEPYLDAMGSLSSIDSKYFLDDARSILRYFLSNASTWRGDTAKSIKAEIKLMINS